MSTLVLEKGMHMAKSLGDLLVEVMLEAGVQRMYGVSGDSLNGITDVIRRREHMRWIHVRHEEAAAFAAGAEAHLTGTLAVCAGSCDWGARTANIIAALWPERCKAMVSVSGYLIGSREINKMPLPPKAELA